MYKMSCKDGGGIKEVWLINPKDMKQTADGSLEIKRKYGKFDRKFAKISLCENEVNAADWVRWKQSEKEKKANERWLKYFFGSDSWSYENEG